MSVVTMKSLLESGVHFGHQTKRWNPKMARFIFSERNGIHIIDLQKTSKCIVSAYDVITKTVKAGKDVLFVGTKKQAQQAIETEAKRCSMPYVNNRWLGGMLTNFTTIKKSIAKLKKIEKMEIDGTFDSLTKKEAFNYLEEKSKLEKNLGGIKEMSELPGIVFVIDTRKEAIAIAEANRLGIPVVAVVDTNCDPTGIDYPIPGNDDAIRAISLFVEIIANAVIDADNNVGIQIIETMPANEEEYQHPEVDKDLQIEAEAEAEKEAEEAAAKKAKAAKKAAKVQESDDNAEADEASEKEEN
ncbi:MAG: 30S ribosomal protein S2 [Sphaerochaetaceae bacterium]|jgi:small subunit ribosomal protein S2